MLEGLFASIYGDAIPLSAFLAASAVSLLLGGLIALCYRKTAGTGGTMVNGESTGRFKNILRSH